MGLRGTNMVCGGYVVWGWNCARRQPWTRQRYSGRRLASGVAGGVQGDLGYGSFPCRYVQVVLRMDQRVDESLGHGVRPMPSARTPVGPSPGSTPVTAIVSWGANSGYPVLRGTYMVPSLRGIRYYKPPGRRAVTFAHPYPVTGSPGKGLRKGTFLPF